MTDSHVEREDKFDVGPTFTVPDVSSLLPPGGGVESGTEQLRSRYFDTDDNNLLRAEMTLRRRTGTTDVGWQLKVPHKPAREEIRLPNKSATVPKQLQRLLYGVTRGQPLRQVATIATERRVHRLIDVDGALLAEIADDYVEASAGEAATIVRFREVEIELGQGDEDLLARLGKRLRKAGAVRATSRSKLARVLSAPASPMAAGLDQHAGAPVMAYLAEQHLVLLAGDLALRRDQDRAIHKTRVAARRFRSTLRSFSDLFEPESVAGLDAELKWFARLLGEIRDRQVQRSGLNRLIEELPEANVLGPVRSRIDTELRAEQSEAWQRLQTELIGARYLALLDALASWMGDPPLTALAQKSPSKLAGMLAKAERQVHRRLARANESDDVELLHRARKAAKRARYAAELTEPVTGGKAARKLRTRYEQLQDLLGRHQDNVVSAELLHRLGAKAGSVPGENGFTFGLLYQRVRRDADDLRVRAARLSRRISGAD